MRTQFTRKQAPAEMPNGGVTVETPRPSATGRISHPSTATLTWLKALTSISEETRAHLRAALGQGVRS